MFESYLAPAAAVCAAVLFSLMLWTSAAIAQTPAPRARYADGAIVKRGDTGSTVKKVQRALGLAADGVYGMQTARAVDAFQARMKLHRSGRVDRSTWRALFRAPVGSAGAGAGPGRASGPGSGPGTASDTGTASGPDTSSGEDSDESGGAAPGAPAPEEPPPGGPATPAPAAPGTCAPTKLANPLRGATKTAGFGDGRNHAGVDLAMPIGTPVRAAACGVVEQAGVESGYGKIVCIRHTSAFVTCYAHLSEIARGVGSVIAQGQVIGRVGMTGHTTGPHLHFETRVNGTARDPAPYLAGTRTIPGSYGAARARLSTSRPSDVVHSATA